MKLKFTKNRSGEYIARTFNWSGHSVQCTIRKHWPNEVTSKYTWRAVFDNCREILEFKTLVEAKQKSAEFMWAQRT